MSKPQSNYAQCILWFWVFDNNLKDQTTTKTKTGYHLSTLTAPGGGGGGGVGGGGGGGMVGGQSTNVRTGRLRPKVQPLTILYTIFQKVPLFVYPFFVYLPFTNGTPFTYPV